MDKKNMVKSVQDIRYNPGTRIISPDLKDIDENIRELVGLLQQRGLDTQASCGGHEKRENPGQAEKGKFYIHFQVPAGIFKKTVDFFLGCGSNNNRNLQINEIWLGGRSRDYACTIHGNDEYRDELVKMLRGE
jgi:hypothetical protein